MQIKARISKLVPEKLKRNLHILQSITANLICGNNGGELVLIGVTGSTGKSTTATMIYHILAKNNTKAGLISTVEARVGNSVFQTGLHATTPDPMDIQKLIRYMRREGATHIVIECSSHALEQGRLGTMKFRSAIFTNIKNDHIDWHKTWNNYARAKARLIDHLHVDSPVIYNSDDRDTREYITAYLANSKRLLMPRPYGLHSVSNIKADINGISFEYENTNFDIPIIGKYNIYNALATVNCALSLGIKINEIAEAFASFQTPEGRMQIMQKEPFGIIINFSHNAYSLENSLLEARNLARNKVIVVLGSAGLRDIEKRFEMGQVASELADIIILAGDDPRTELIRDINTKILDGAKENISNVTRFASSKEYHDYMKRRAHLEHKQDKALFSFDENSINSRIDAINHSIRIAGPGDIVLIEGKGHETSFSINNQEIPYTDQRTVKDILDTL